MRSTALKRAGLAQRLDGYEYLVSPNYEDCGGSRPYRVSAKNSVAHSKWLGLNAQRDLCGQPLSFDHFAYQGLTARRNDHIYVICNRQEFAAQYRPYRFAI